MDLTTKTFLIRTGVLFLGFVMWWSFTHTYGQPESTVDAFFLAGFAAFWLAFVLGVVDRYVDPGHYEYRDQEFEIKRIQERNKK